MDELQYLQLALGRVELSRKCRAEGGDQQHQGRSPELPTALGELPKEIQIEVCE
jgi:hypothetical protein